MVKAQVWIKVREFSGVPTKADFKLVEEELPALRDGGSVHISRNEQYKPRPKYKNSLFLHLCYNCLTLGCTFRTSVNSHSRPQIFNYLIFWIQSFNLMFRFCAVNFWSFICFILLCFGNNKK